MIPASHGSGVRERMVWTMGFPPDPASDPSQSEALERSLPSAVPPSQAALDKPALGVSLELVRRGRQGDRLAIDALFRRYQGRIQRIARIRMGPRVRSFMESADLVQETFVVAERRLHDFEPHSHAAIIHWLACILQRQINDANDYATAERRDRANEVPIEASSSHSAPGTRARLEPEAPDSGPSALASQHELEEIYDACVQNLEGDQREVILLRDYAGGSWEFLREQLGRPTEEAVQQLYSRARSKLARALSTKIKD